MMNELMAQFKELSEYLSSPMTYLKIANDGYGCILNTRNQALHRWVRGDHPAYLQAIGWDCSTEGVEVIQNCINQIKTTPSDFSWL